MNVTYVPAPKVEVPPAKVIIEMTLEQAQQLHRFFGKMGGEPTLNRVYLTAENGGTVYVRVPQGFRKITVDPLYTALDPILRAVGK